MLIVGYNVKCLDFVELWKKRKKRKIWIFDWFLLSEEGILRDTERIEDGIRTADSPLIVTNASNIARRANRVLQVAEMEAQNSEDPLFVDRVNEAAENLKSSQYY